MKTHFFLLISLLIVSCGSPEPSKRFNSHPEAKELYDAISVRNAEALLDFTDHKELLIRRQAWRALHITPVDAEHLLNKATKSRDELAWFAVSGHSLKPDQLRFIENYYAQEPRQNAHVLKALASQGDQTTLQFLLKHLEQSGTFNKDIAKAIGSITMRVAPDAGAISYIIDQAVKHPETVISRHLLYPFYRSSRLKLSNEDASKLFVRLRERKDPDLLRQYMIRILSREHWNMLKDVFPYTAEGISYNLAIDWIRSVPSPLTAATAEMLLSMLDHPNENIRLEVLQRYKASTSLPQYVLLSLQSRLNALREHDEYAYVAALYVLHRNRAGSNLDEADELDALLIDNPYLADAIFQYRMLSMSEDNLLLYLQSFMRHEDRLLKIAAVKALSVYFNALPAERMNSRAAVVRSYFFEALQANDRGVSYELASSFRNKTLYRPEDFPRLKKVLEKLDLKADVEVFQAMSFILWNNSGKDGQAFLEGYIKQNYAPLNRYLARTGIPAEVIEDGPKSPLLTPNFSRVVQLSEHPRWELVTTKGTIVMQLDPLRAPATVSALDSLSKAGLYENVPFHRVVANFVIQGGDFERKDGLGGPEYQLPTEPSELSFKRGSLGMASAGPDTEGSQFFIMHQDAPHLNGRYTRFGEVLEGMDVVDRIQHGDLVLKSRIYPHFR